MSVEEMDADAALLNASLSLRTALSGCSDNPAEQVREALDYVEHAHEEVKAGGE